MVAANKHRQKGQFSKTASGTKKEYFKGKHKKVLCAIDGTALAGVPHETKTNKNKYSKTQRRPSAPFGGILSGSAREKVFVETGKVVAGIKQLDDVDQKYRSYVRQALARTGTK